MRRRRLAVCRGHTATAGLFRRKANPPSSTTSEQALYRLLRLFLKVRARSHRCSSSPTTTRCAGLVVGAALRAVCFFGDPVRGCRFSLSMYGPPLRDHGTVSVKTVGTHSVRPQASSAPLTWQGAATRRAAVQGPFSLGRSGSPAAKPVRWLILSPAAARVRRGGSGRLEIEQMFYPVAI